MKSSKNVRRGNSFRNLNDSLSSGGQSLQDELGSLEAELGSFNNDFEREMDADDAGDYSDVYEQMAGVLKKSPAILDLDDVEERDDADDLDSDSDDGRGFEEEEKVLFDVALGANDGEALRTHSSAQAAPQEQFSDAQPD